MEYKKGMIILIFAILMFAIAGVSAVDGDDADIMMGNDTSEAIAASDELDGQNIVTISEENDIVNVNIRPFSDLQSAIDNAGEGSEIILNDSYSLEEGGKTLKISKALTINGRDNYIDADSLDRILEITADGTVVLKNINFYHGATSQMGAAIYNNHHSTTLKIIDCSFSQNSADDGGGAIYSTGKLTVSGSTFEDNEASGGDGGAIYCEGTTHISDSEFTSNDAGDLKLSGHKGGAIYSKGKCYIESSRFYTNCASEGAAVYACEDLTVTGRTGGNIFRKHSASFATIYTEKDLYINWEEESNSSCSIDYNSHESIGAIWCKGNLYGNLLIMASNTASGGMDVGVAIRCEGETHVNSSEFSQNIYDPTDLQPGDIIFAQARGGAICAKGKCYIDSCQFEGNFALKGGAIFAHKDLTITGEGNVFKDNQLEKEGKLLGSAYDKDGGAIYCVGKLTVSNASFTNNLATIDGGAIYCENDCRLYNCRFEDNSASGFATRKSYGGAVCTEKSIIAHNCSFKKNDADYGGTGTDSKGGAVYINGEGNQEFISCQFEENKAEFYGGAIYLESSNTHLKLSDCLFYANKVGVDGGAVYCPGETEISDSTFTGNRATGKFTDHKSYGGAVLSNKYVTVDNCNFSDNHAYNKGGAIYAYADIKVTGGSDFRDNIAKVDGGAVYCEGKTTVSDTSFSGNKATGDTLAKSYGGAIRSEKYMSLEGCEFKDNHAFNHGGAVYADGDIKIKSSNFTANVAKEGGAVYTSIIYETASDSIFSQNKATDGKGGAVYINNKCHPGFKSCTFEKNTCTGDGGALYLDSTNTYLTLSGCTFQDNAADEYGGAVYAPHAPLYFSDMEVKNCEFTGNSAQEGGAIYASLIYKVSNSKFTKNKATGGCGGAVYVNNKYNPEFKSCTFEHNTCTKSGGAIYFDSTDVAAKISDSTFNSNSARANGGAVYVSCNGVDWGSLELKSSTFNSNTAQKGGAVYTGIIQGTVTHCEFISNRATYGDGKTDGDGGAVYINNKGDAEFVSCRFEQNSAYNRGGALYLDSTHTHLKISYCTFVDNSAENKKYEGARGGGHCVFNSGTYEKVDGEMIPMCWFGVNSPNFKGQFIEYHTLSSDEEHRPSNHLKISIILNESLIYINNEYEAAVHFSPDLKRDLLHSEGQLFTIYGGAFISNVDGNRNDITADVEFTQYNCKLYATLDHETVLLDVSAHDKQKNEINITSCDDVKYPDSLKVTYEIAHMFNGSSYLIKTDSGRVVRQGNLTSPNTLTVDGLSAGKYFITIETPETRTFSSCLATRGFQVTKSDLDLMIVVFNETYPEDVECIVYAGTDGEFNLTVAGCSTVVIVKDHFAYFHRGTVDAGTYEANVSFAGNDFYNPASNTTTFTVFPEGTLFEIEVNASQITYGQTATVTHSITDGATGTIKYYLADGTFLGELPVNTNLTLPVLDAGSYVVIANYSGDPNHLSSQDSAHITVKRALPVFEIESDAVDYGKNAVVTHMLEKDATGSIRYFLYNGTFLGEMSVKRNFTMPVLDAGSYVVIANYSGNRNYLNATANTTLTVNRIKPAFEVKTQSVIYGEHANMTHTLPGNAAGTIRYYLEDGSFMRELPVSEILTLPVLDAGTYVIFADYSGDGNYLNATANATLTVNRTGTQIMADSLNTTYGNDDYLVIVLKDIKGYPVAGCNLTVDLNGVKSNYTTDEKGRVNISTNTWNAQTYSVLIIFSGNGNYLNSTNVTNVTVSRSPSSIASVPLTTTYQIHKYLVVNLRDGLNRPIRNADTFITINGVTYKCRTDDNGDARLIIRLHPDTFTAKVTFDNANYLSSQGYVTVTVFKATPKITAAKKTFKKSKKVKKYTITLKDNIGKAIKKAKVTLKVKGKTYKAKTNSKGKATFKIKKLTKKGRYNAVITYRGNMYFNKVTKKVKIAIK